MLAFLFVVSLAWILNPCHAELLNGFLPSDIESRHGKVSRVHHETELIDVGAGYLAHSPRGGSREFHFEEPVWIIAYETSIFDAHGGEPRQNYLCHTFLGDQDFTQHHHPKMNAIYSDAFTRSVKAPEGFGLFLEAERALNWLPLFNNRGGDSERVGMHVEIHVIREKDLRTPLQRLYATLISTQMPHLFFVPPGRHKQETVFDLPGAARIHFLGTHVHPYAESMEVLNLSADEQVWRGESRWNSDGEMVGFDVFSSAEGYPVSSADRFRVVSTYNNPTGRKIDAMAGLFVFYSMDE